MNSGNNIDIPLRACLIVSTKASTMTGAFLAIDVINATNPSTSCLNADGAVAAS